MREEYIQRLVSMMETDAALVAPGEELQFLTGFSPMQCERFQGLFVKKNGKMFYVCNTLYRDELRGAFGDQLPLYCWHDNEGMQRVIEILKEQCMEGCTVAVSSTAQAFNILEIAAGMRIKFVNGKPLMEEIRIHKSSEELNRMRESAAVADSAYEAACAMIRPGVSEGDIRDVIVKTMREKGGYGFDCIVASGPNSSYPHYSSFGRVIEEGDCIVMDWGCHLKEMMSDISRTVFVGSVTPEQRRVYELVNRAQRIAEETAAEGVLIPLIDKAARNVLNEEGYAETLVNRVGHGIGYSVHEGPYINQLNHRVLEREMCFSVEPGVYLAGRFGMRVENIVCINEIGQTEVLNHADRSLRIIDWYKK